MSKRFTPPADRPAEIEGVPIDWTPLPHNGIRDLRGKRVGKLVVKAYAYTKTQANGMPMVYWLCQCDCGNEHTVSRPRLQQGLTKSCGCLSVVGHKGVLASQKTQSKRSNMVARTRLGLPPNPPVQIIGDPVCVFAHDSLLAYACFRWGGYVPAAHHQLIAKYLEKVEKGEIKRLMIFQPPRSGKLLADSTPVLTPDGWKTHGGLKVGDSVYNLTGHPVAVLAVSEKQSATMRVLLSNLEAIKCHENHEWGVLFHSETENKLVYQVIETKEIQKGRDKGIRYYLPETPFNLDDMMMEISLVRECDPELGHCIQVDSQDGLYLVGKSLIPTHNSMLVSEFFPAWFLGRNPDKRVVAASYGQELASDFGRKVRNQMVDPVYGEIFPGVGLAGDSAAADKFEMNPPHQGGYVAVGVGGALTGRGAHCFVAGTKISTNQGNIYIEDLIFSPSSVKILSFNIEESKLEYKGIEAFASRQGFGIYRITTSSGRMVEVTGDHLIFVSGKGYIAASELTSSDFVLCVLQEELYSACIRDAETHQEKTKGYLLFSRMFGVSSCSKKQTPMQNLRESSRKKGKAILRWVSAKTRRAKSRLPASKNNMPNLQYRVYGAVAWAWARKVCSVLQQALFGNWSFSKYAWRREPALATWTRSFEEATAFSESLSNNAPSCFETGQQYLRSVWDKWNFFARSSFGWECHKQCSIKFSDVMPKVSFTTTCNNGLWTGYDKVESVIRVRETATVYDIQVETNHNLFANGILCHNCLIIDDPVKSREDSDSEASRRKLKDWYTAVAYTRLMDNGSIIICQTRWHTEDLSGWLLKEHKHEKWTVLNLPAINEKGEALWPEKYPLEVLEQIKKTLPERDWQALYQQRPFIEEGGIFKRQWWKMWPDAKPLPECEFIIQSWDTAYSDKEMKSSDYSARVTLGVFKRPDDECHNIFVLEAWKDRVEYADLRKEAVRAYQDYEPDKVIIEKKSSGLVLVQDLRRSGLPIATYTPTKDKITRAYAAQSLLENGRVYYPARRWAEDFIASLATFPQGAHDDEVDAFTQAIIWLQNSFLVMHSEDAKRRKIEDDEDDELPSNVTRFRSKRRKAAYG